MWRDCAAPPAAALMLARNRVASAISVLDPELPGLRSPRRLRGERGKRVRGRRTRAFWKCRCRLVVLINRRLGSVGERRHFHVE